MLNAGNTYKYINQISGDYYNCVKLLTYGRPWNFVTGSRSVGKSTGVAAFVVIDYLQNGHKFIYCRRTKDEVLLTCRDFFSNAVQLIKTKTDLKIHAVEYENGYFYIIREEGGEKEECGCIIPLSLEQKYKSGNYSEYHNLIFDEFICQDSTRYLGSRTTPDREYRSILSLYQTIDRGIDKPYRNETRFFFLGNTATIYNPLFLSIGISDFISEEARYIAPKGKPWILEQVKEVKAIKEAEDSFVYQLSDAQARDYAFKNKGTDNEEFIQKLPQQRIYLCTLGYKGEKYGVWSETNRGNYFIGSVREDRPDIISLDAETHNANDLMMITQWNEYPIIKQLLYKFRTGHLFFANGKIKNVFYKYFKLMP